MILEETTQTEGEANVDFSKLSVAYIDADILLYRAVAYTESEFDGEEVALPRMALSAFHDLLANWLKEIRKDVQLKDYYLCVTVGKTFRNFIYADYKANRKAVKIHPAIPGLKLLVRDLDACIWEENIEADDLIALKITASDEAFAVSADKDFLTVPGTTFFPKSHGKKAGKWEQVSVQDADRQLFKQSMTGDSVDNYKGIDKCGPVKADKILEGASGEEQLWFVTLAAFKRGGYTEDYALTMVRLARILRNGEYDFETKKIKLWNQPDLQSLYEPDTEKDLEE